MATTLRPAFTAGVLLGVTYLLCAVFPIPFEMVLLLGSPFVFALLAVFLSGRQSASAFGVGTGANMGAMTGVVVGLILIVISTPLLYLLFSAGDGKLAEELRRVGLELPFGRSVLPLVVTIVEAVTGVVIAIIGGLVGASIFGRR